MGSTYHSLHYHLVFSTKHRQPLINPTFAKRLYGYMQGTITGLDGFPQGIGGIEDHVHLLVGLSPSHCLKDFVRELKKSATNWSHESMGYPQFFWQEGYAAFTVSPSARLHVQSYIANQHKHHNGKSYGEELAEMLESAGVEYVPYDE